MLLPKQTWKDIEGYENKYQVSNTGKVRSLNYNHTGKVKILKQHIDRNGYVKVSLCKYGKRKTYFVHRLVALAFITNENNLPEVNHKDENKTNNCVWNLEWCDRKYNVNYGSIKEKYSKEKKGKNNPIAKPIIMLDMSNKPIACFNCMADGAEYCGKRRNGSNITQCVKRQTKSAYNHIWRYINITEL